MTTTKQRRRCHSRALALVLLAANAGLSMAFAPLTLKSSCHGRCSVGRSRPCFELEGGRNQLSNQDAELRSTFGALRDIRQSSTMSKLIASVFAASLVYLARCRSLLWPGARPDPSRSEPLPPGSLGCPFFGSNILAGSSTKGPETFYREASTRLGHPRLWKFYFLGASIASVSGAELVQDVLNREFTTLGPMQETSGKRKKKARSKKKRDAIFGTDNLMFERDKDRHAYLRRLVGSGMTPTALGEALPTIQQTATECISRIAAQLQEGPVKMEEVCVDYTMEIVRRQLLGLESLPESERVIFREMLATWLSGMYSIISTHNIPFLIKRSKPFKARKLIEVKLEEKIDALLKNGPDSSTLSNMLFATEDGKRRLTREEVVENSLLLVAAGTENSASTLTLAMLLMGLHPRVYQQLVEEQHQYQLRNPEDNLTSEQLDKEFPYLDAVVKETMRLGAITGGFPRRVLETMVIDGKQIPKGWFVFTNIRLTHQLDPVTRLEDDSHMDVHQGFLPERWLKPDTTPADFIPFGSGPRYCLGASLAVMEIKVFLALFARHIPSFHLIRDSNDARIRWNPRTMVPRPADGVLVELSNKNE